MSRSYKRNAPYTVVTQKDSQSPELKQYLRNLSHVPRFSARELRELDRRLSRVK